VSHTTVSRALRGSSLVNSETRNRILSLAESMGYLPDLRARSLVEGKRSVIGICTPDVLNPQFAQLCLRLRDTLWDRGYTCVFSLGHAVRALTTFIGERVDGIVLIYGLDAHADIERLVRRASTPCVTVGFLIDGIDGVGIDRRFGVAQGVHHLVERGLRRIGFAGVRGADAKPHLQPHIEKESSFYEAVANYGLTVRPEWEFCDARTRKDGYRFAQALASLPTPDRPEAVFCQNDLVALGMTAGLLGAGIRVPDDVSILGFDDIPESAYAYPPLTTIRQPRDELVRSATELLLARISGELTDGFVHRRECGHVVVRASVRQ